MNKVKVLVTQSCPTLCDPMDCSPPGFSIHGILQERILEWIAIPFSRESSWPRDWTQVFCIASRFFAVWATREAQSVKSWTSKPNLYDISFSYWVTLHHSSIVFSSVHQFSRSVVSNSVRPHESQHARPPCPSPTPRVHPNSCASSWWCHPAISSSVIPFSSCP